MLVKKTILREMDAGNIHISPFSYKNLGSNSFDVTLNHKLLVYTSKCLDMNLENPTTELVIPPEGLVLLPGELYLGATNECATSKKYIPCLDGRSSVGRLGISVHVTAGFGDVGFAYDEKLDCTLATWTLEITVVKPIRVYANRRVAQVFFFETSEEVEASDMYHGKYSRQVMPQASLAWKDVD